MIAPLDSRKSLNFYRKFYWFCLRFLSSYLILLILKLALKLFIWILLSFSFLKIYLFLNLIPYLRGRWRWGGRAIEIPNPTNRMVDLSIASRGEFKGGRSGFTIMNDFACKLYKLLFSKYGTAHGYI